MGESSNPGPEPGDSKRKKRNSKNNLQLEVLKAAFEKNPKPTRKARETLSEETGLSLREIQVSLSHKKGGI